MRLAPVACLALLLSACHSTMVPTQRPPEGYRALRILETQTLLANAGRSFSVQAGQIFVQDRALEDGSPLWCPVPLGELVTCAMWDGQRMTFHASGPFPSPPLLLAPGSVAEFRLR